MLWNPTATAMVATFFFRLGKYIKEIDNHRNHIKVKPCKLLISSLRHQFFTKKDAQIMYSPLQKRVEYSCAITNILVTIIFA
jgi:hypothetical protein